MRIRTLINLFLTIIFSVIFSITSKAQTFNVTKVSGHGYSYKPSIAERLNGIEEVVVFVPRNMSEFDKNVYPYVESYFRQLGMNVSTKYVKYKVEKEEDYRARSLTIWNSLAENVGKYWDNINTLLVIPTYDCSTIPTIYGASKIVQFVKLLLFDPVLEYDWTFQFELPKTTEKFYGKLRSLISSNYSYSFAAANKPPYLESNWTETTFKEYFSSSNHTPLEGVYEGDTYKIGVKSHNENYYLVYLSGALNTRDWKSGDIKAVLEPTATPAIYKAKWYDKWKQIMKSTVIFKEGLMTVYADDYEPDQYLKLYPALSGQQETESNEWSGTGFALKDGYVVTNYHVVDGARTITIKGIEGDFNKSYTAYVIGSDKINDLALLKISDPSFQGFGTIPYSITSTTSEVGEDVFVLGYPLISTMGDEIKLTTGVISSKTGYQGDVALYQISAPIQPGNSGGPLFDKNGNIIGVVSAKHAGAENVGYAIKSNYLRNLVESCASTSIIPTNNYVSNLPLTGKVKFEKTFVFFIHCTTNNSSTLPSNENTYSSIEKNDIKAISFPSISSRGDNSPQLNKVILTPSDTILVLSCNNKIGNGQYYEWVSISSQAHLLVGGRKYILKSAGGIAIKPNKTYFSYKDETKTFTLIFPPIPIESTSMDFIESEDSDWKLYGINITQ